MEGTTSMKTTDLKEPSIFHHRISVVSLALIVLVATICWLLRTSQPASANDMSIDVMAQPSTGATSAPTSTPVPETPPFDGWDSVACGHTCMDGAKVDNQLLAARLITLGFSGKIPDNWDELTTRQKIGIPGVTFTRRRINGQFVDIPGFVSSYTPFKDISVFIYNNRVYWNNDWLIRDRPRFFNTNAISFRDGPGESHPVIGELAPYLEGIGDLGYKVTGYAGGHNITEAQWIEVRDWYDEPVWIEAGSGKLIGPIGTVPVLDEVPSIDLTRPLQVRSGPGSEYPVIGAARIGSHYHLCGQNDATTWIKLCGKGDQELWIPANDPTISAQMKTTDRTNYLPIEPAPELPVPLVQGTIKTGIENIQQFLDTCPQNDPNYGIFSKDFVVRLDGTILTAIPCSEPVSEMPADEYTWPLHSMQIVRTIYYLSENTQGYLPWTSSSLYDWLVANVQGINLQTNFLYDYLAYCCDYYGGRTYLTAPASADDGLLPVPETSHIIDGVSLFIHEARHADIENSYHIHGCAAEQRPDGPASCDLQYDVLMPGAFGVEYWLDSNVASGYLNIGIGCMPSKSSVIVWIRDAANWLRSNFVRDLPPVATVNWPVGGPCLAP